KQVDKINKEMLEQIELERQLENDLKKAKTKLNNDHFDEADALLEGLESIHHLNLQTKKLSSFVKIMMKNINPLKKMKRKQNYYQNMKRNELNKKIKNLKSNRKIKKINLLID